MRIADYVTGSIDLEGYLGELEQVRLRTDDEGVVVLTRIVEKLVRDVEALLMEEGS